MATNGESKPKAAKFAGMEVPPDLTKGNFFFLYFNTLIAGMLMGMPAIVQPAFLNDIVKIDQQFAGSINGLLQNMSQIATLLFVALVGVLSDKVGRKILAFAGFLVIAVFLFLMSQASGIASGLNMPAGLSSAICALLSFMPGKAAEFAEFSPALLITYITRFVIGIGLVLAYPQFITMVADYTYEKDRGKGMAMNGVCMGIASILVFAICAPIQKQTGVVILMYILATISFAGAVCSWGFLKDRLPDIKKQQAGLKEIIPVVRKSLPLKATYWCSLITRADIVILATFLVAWGVKYGQEVEMAAKDATMKAALPMLVMSVVSLVAFPVLGVMLDKWGRVPTILLSLVSATVGMLLLAVSPTPFSGLVYLAVIFAAVGMAGSIAGANTLASDVSPKGMLGSILGGLNTMQPIGILFFMGVGGYLFDAFGPGWAFGLKGIATLVLAAWMFMVKGALVGEIAEKTSLDGLPFALPWDEEAKKMLEKVPAAFREAAVSGTEDYARQHSHETVTAEVMAAYRKELGM